MKNRLKLHLIHLFSNKISFYKKSKFIFFSYIFALLVLSVIPFSKSKHIHLPMLKMEFRADYLIHFFLYLPFARLFHMAYTKRLNIKILSGILFAFITEFIQYYLPYRTFNINDLLANILGVFAGLVVFILFLSFQKKRVKTIV